MYFNVLRKRKIRIIFKYNYKEAKTNTETTISTKLHTSTETNLDMTQKNTGRNNMFAVSFTNIFK